MIGVPFNPNNCIFIANQALNSNQFDPNVPDTGNLTTHTLLFDTVNNSLIWVNTKTNIIVQETSGSGAGVIYEQATVDITSDGLGSETLTIALNNAAPIALNKSTAISFTVPAPVLGTVITNTSTGATAELGALISGNVYQLLNVTGGGFSDADSLTWPGLVGPAEVDSCYIGFTIPTQASLKYCSVTSGSTVKTSGSFGKSNGITNDCFATRSETSFTNCILIDEGGSGFRGGINNVLSNSFDVFLRKITTGISMKMSFDIQE
jgi:hypothetical protein